MVYLSISPPPYKKSKDIIAEWKTFRKGLNLLLRPTELTREEYSVGDNMMLIGSGVPTGRWGSSTYFTVNATGTARGFATFNNTASLTNELIGLTDQGYLAKKNSTSSTTITGQSYPSGSVVRAEQLGGYTYFASKDVSLTRYNGGSLEVFATISAPSGLYVTNTSGVSGTSIYSWMVTAISSTGGETTPGQISLGNLPQDLTTTRVDIRWTAPSAATISGFQIYRGMPGDERFLAAVGASTTRYIDLGDPASESFNSLAPLSNTTGGVKSRFIKKFNDRLVMVDASNPTKLLISGPYPKQSSFNWIDGGGILWVDPDSGQDITGIEIQPGSDKIMVYKDFAHYAVTLDFVTLGNFPILNPSYQPVSTAVGASNPDTLQVVENDIFYFGRKGLYVTGFEPNFLSLIRTNEVSARIRPYLALLNNSDYLNANALYINNKYLLSFPDRQEVIVYDRERGSFVGLWKFPFGITKMKKYVDSSGTERWVFGVDSSNQTYTLEPSINSDNGTTIAKKITLNKESFSSWSVLKIIKLFYILFRNIQGSVTVNLLIEKRDGSTSTAKSFTITGSETSGKTGWGVGLWGTKLWGQTSGSPVIGTDELYRWSQLFKSGRLLQVEIVANEANSNFELLGVKSTASSQGEGSLSSAQRI